jgi:hypothetical protein
MTCAPENHEKCNNTIAKMSFFLRRPPVFLPNRPVLGPFLAVKLLRVMQVVLPERLARLEKTAVFQKTPQEFKIIHDLEDFVRGMFVKGMGDNLPSVIPLTIIALTVALAAFCRKIGRGDSPTVDGEHPRGVRAGSEMRQQTCVSSNDCHL